jgi:hypothetical protein
LVAGELAMTSLVTTLTVAGAFTSCCSTFEAVTTTASV